MATSESGAQGPVAMKQMICKGELVRLTMGAIRPHTPVVIVVCDLDQV